MDEDTDKSADAQPLTYLSPCPNCGGNELWRESVDVGVGIIHGPFGCDWCGWSEDPRFDSSKRKADAPAGWYATPQGALVNIEREREEIDAGLARFGLPPVDDILGPRS